MDHDITHASLEIAFCKKVFDGLPRVSPSNVHKPDMLHTIYLGIFQYMMDLIQGFRKQHRQLDTFDEVWKSLPPYPGFLVSTKGYREVTG